MDAPGTTLREALLAAQAGGLERLDAQLLLLQALGRGDADRAWLLAHDDEALEPAAALRFAALRRRRQGGEPVAYIAGRKPFFGLELVVDARVLVPRPDTETLVEWALERLAADDAPAAPRVVDLGTGSGAIALALASAAPRAELLALDASADALAVASANAARLGLAVRFEQGDWLAQVSDHFHLIVSNPPYIADGDPHLTALVHEPLRALTSGADGLDDIRKIVRQAPARLLPGGWLLLEHGHDQADAVAALLTAQGFVRVQHRLDLAGIRRCSGGEWPAAAGQTESAG